MKRAAVYAWTVAGTFLLLLTYLTLAPDPWWFMGQAGREAEQSIDSTFAGYSQHFGAYAVLAVLLVGASFTTQSPPVKAVAMFSALHGVATESLQHFIPLRTCDWTDVLANTLGVNPESCLLFSVCASGRDDRCAIGRSNHAGLREAVGISQ